LTATELRKLSPEHRDAILAEAAAQAEEEYRTNRGLTDSEALAEESRPFSGRPGSA
jgi:hypothetical protein